MVHKENPMKAETKNYAEGATKTNMVTQYLDKPALWTLDNPEYDWLTPKARHYLDTNFGFDYGDILDAEAHFLTSSQIADYLMATEDELNLYCNTLWRKPWTTIHRALSLAARNAIVDNVFMPYANNGNSAAISIMSHISKAEREAENNELRVRIVNDLDSEESPKEEGE